MVEKRKFYKKVLLIILCIGIVSMLQSACELLFLDHTSYGKALRAIITQNLKAQINLPHSVKMLASTPDGNGVFVIFNNNTISYYNSGLKQGDTWTFTGLEPTFRSSMYPASSNFLAGTETIYLTPYKECTRIFLFKSPTTYFEKLYSQSASMTHTIELAPEQLSNFDIVRTGINMFRTENNQFQLIVYEFDPITMTPTMTPTTYYNNIPLLFYTKASTAYGLQVAYTRPQFTNMDQIEYAFQLNRYSYNYSAGSLGLTGFQPSLITYNVAVPLNCTPSYFFSNEQYFAVIFSSDSPEREALCIAFSRMTGKIISSIHCKDFSDDDTFPYFAFGNDTIYISVFKKLFAVEVRP